MISQGIVLMIAGMGIVIVVTKVSMKAIGNFDSILPQEAPKKKPAAAAATDDDANIALAIAVAMG